jgi:hypothetical protein
VEVNGGTSLMKQSVFLNNQYVGEMNLVSSDGSKRIYEFLFYFAGLQIQNEIRVRIQDNTLDIVEDSINIIKQQ